MEPKYLYRLCVCAIATATAVFASAADLRVAAHIHSRFSHGSSESIGQIAAYAQERGIDALLLTDTALAGWSYGLPLPANHLEFTHSEDSILKLTPQAYLKEIEEAAKAHPAVVLIAGAEPAAFYRWSGRPWSGLVLHDWHRHLVLAGLHNAENYSNLPILGNRQAYAFNWRNLWPVMLILLGFIAKKGEIPALPKLLYLLSAVFLVNAFPFRSFPWNQYEPSTPWGPYRNLARYGKSKGALVFLAHPESPNWTRPVRVSGHVSVQTDAYPEGLQEIPDLDGFGVFMEGNKTMAEPGGAWDSVLEDYCEGRRDKPVWGIAEIDYKGWGAMGTYIDTDYMVVRAQEKTEAAILDALRSGRFYSLMPAKSGALRLDVWEASVEGKTAGAGETLTADRPVQLTLSLSRAGKNVPTRVRVIRNGNILIDDLKTTPAKWAFQEPPGACSYYRVMVRDGDNGELAANPIFIRASPPRSR